jgi:Zn-dependent peptidase ImmA (M78 family)
MLKRGFKSWGERVALAYRKELGIDKSEPLPARDLAQYLKVRLLTPNEVPGLSSEAISLLLGVAASSWSAVTVTKREKNAVIYNSSHSVFRQSNDIMHELSHVIVGHSPQMIHSQDTGIFLRHYNENQEHEADCLSSILLLPKDALLKIKFSDMSHDTAARTYGTSQTLLRMRLNTSGINYIFVRSRK